jgi:CubicO group peptidase (beta-lactamase class C family)
MLDELETRRPQINQILIENETPAMVLAVAETNQQPLSLVFVPDPDGLGAPYAGLTQNSLFAVASVTKLATALAVLRLAADGTLDLDADLEAFLPHSPSSVAALNLRRMLVHTAGLPNEVELPDGQQWETYYTEVPTHPVPGQHFSYSSFGYDLAGAVIEQATTWPFAELVRETVLEPLEAEGYFGWEPRQCVPRTGYFDYAFNDADRRLLGKPSGGLLATADACLRLVRAYAWSPPGFDIPQHLLLEARQDHTNGLGPDDASVWRPMPPWGLGPELRGPSQTKAQYHYSPAAASDSSFGHFGASGSLAWCDPERGLSWAILSARTTGPGPWHYPAWRRLGDVIFEAAEAAQNG